MATPSRAAGSAASPALAPESARASVCVICSTLAPACAARTRSTRNASLACGAWMVQSTSTTPGVVSNTCFTYSRRGQPRAVARPVDLGHERGEHGGPRRDLGDLRRRAVAGGDGVDAGAHGDGDGVALAAALVLGEQVHLHVGDVVAAAHEVVAHEPVEVERRRGARVHLGALDLWRAAHVRGDLLGERRASTRAWRPREGRAPPGTRSCCRRAASSPSPPPADSRATAAEQEHDSGGVERQAQPLAFDERRHEARVPVRGPGRLLGLVQRVMRRRGLGHVAAEQPERRRTA